MEYFLDAQDVFVAGLDRHRSEEIGVIQYDELIGRHVFQGFDLKIDGVTFFRTDEEFQFVLHSVQNVIGGLIEDGIEFGNRSCITQEMIREDPVVHDSQSQIQGNDAGVLHGDVVAVQRQGDCIDDEIQNIVFNEVIFIFQDNNSFRT